MRRRPHLHLGALVASLALLGASTTIVLTDGGVAGARALHAQPLHAQSDTADLEAAQNALRQHQADVASELDVLRATSEQVVGALAALDQNVGAQQEQTVRAGQAAQNARQADVNAIALVTAKQAEVDALAARLRAMAVNLYVRPPVEDVVHAVVNGAPNDAPVALALARFRVEDVTVVLDQAKLARDALAAAQAVAARAREEAERTERVERDKLGALQTARAQQQTFAESVSDRIDRALGEAAMLSEQDAELSNQIRQRELDLAAHLRDSMAAGGGTVVIVTGNGNGATIPPLVLPAVAPAPDATPPSAPPATEAQPPIANSSSPQPDPTPSPPTPTAPPATAPPATAPPTTSPPAPPVTIPPRVITITPVDTTWVRGIEVATRIAGNLDAMMAAAEADGIHLSGGGYRNILDQIEIRREVCGPTDYDIFLKPSWECSPPVARPGSSMHEKGLAIDFSDENDLIRSQSHPAFIWLAAHAAAYGFYNLPVEPWHWSTTGG